MKTTLISAVMCLGLFLSGSLQAENLYDLSEGKTITGRVTLIYPVMGKDGMSVRQYKKYKQLSQKVTNAHYAGQSTTDISSALNDIWNSTKTAVGVKDEGDNVRVILSLDHSHDNDPYAEPEDLREGLADWKGDGNGGYRARVLLLNGDIYNLYLNDQGYNQLVVRGFRQGVNVLVKGGEGKNLIGVIQ